MRFKAFAVFTVLSLLLCRPGWPQSTQVVPRTNDNLLVCSWNIKWFKDSGRDLAKLAKVIANFDICGIIELQSDKVLEGLASALENETGERWAYIQSNHTGNQNYFEQFGFIWRDAKARVASGHVGNAADFGGVFRHQPYVASFRSGNFDFRFLLIHTRWTTPDDRKREVEEIAKDFTFFRGLTREKDVILAGDFNYSHGAPQMGPIRALPGVKNLVPSITKTTLKGSGEGFSSWYDHIYVDSNATTEATGTSNAYDFVAGLGFPSTQEAKKKVSDHLPVWAEFRTNSPDDD